MRLGGGVDSGVARRTGRGGDWKVIGAEKSAPKSVWVSGVVSIRDRGHSEG